MSVHFAGDILHANIRNNCGALAKTYEVVSLETARNIAKKFKASLKQKTDLYVIEGILIDAGYKKEPVNL